jgi:hypothetical protein
LRASQRELGGEHPDCGLMSLGARSLSQVGCESAPAGVRWRASPGTCVPGSPQSLGARRARIATDDQTTRVCACRRVAETRQRVEVPCRPIEARARCRGCRTEGNTLQQAVRIRRSRSQAVSTRRRRVQPRSDRPAAQRRRPRYRRPGDASRVRGDAWPRRPRGGAARVA